MLLQATLALSLVAFTSQYYIETTGRIMVAFVAEACFDLSCAVF